MTDLERRFIQARHDAIATEYSNLNPCQRQGVLATEGPLLLLAGAGSGKTTVLIHRVANLLRFGRGSDTDEIPIPISEDEVQFLEQYAAAPDAAQRPLMEYLCAVEPARPWEVLAITFTNKAANELKERLGRMLGEEVAADVWASTFHSACVRILRRDIDRLGFDRSFTIYDSDDSKRVIKDIIKELELEEKSFPPREVQTIISRAKNDMQTPEDFAEQGKAINDWRKIRMGKVYSLYNKKLRDANALDFDDLLWHTVRLLETAGDVREYYQRKFRYILIDEYQDTNALQYRLAALLTNQAKNICVVGDDDQSIYRFRGADITNILSFERQFKGARVIRLEQNYRSTQNILDAANAVIRHNQGRKGKTLWTENGRGELVTVKTTYNESDEANFVLGQIMMYYRRGGNWGDCAVLYRTNAQSNAMEYACKRNGVPYKIYGGLKFFDRAEVKDMLAYLCLINNRADDLRLRRILNNPPRGIGPKTVEMAERQAEAAALPLYSIISDPYSYPSMEKAAQKLMAFTVMIEECAELLETESLADFYDEMLVRTGYLAMLEEKNDVESRTRAENVRELKSSILNYMENSDAPTLAGFLEEIALYTDIEQYDADADAVVMMTMHSAKGLEFPNVFLVGVEEGLFPGTRSLGDPDEMEEERRLCYVAITRAKQTLCICYARQRMLYGRTNSCLPSRFIDELPAQCIERVGVTPRRAETERYERPRASLYGDDGWYRPGGPAKPAKDYSTLTQTLKKPKAAASFAKGDMVMHKAFGKGMVLTVLPMGGDALLEIAFDGVGTKRLMANAAGAHMSKL